MAAVFDSFGDLDRGPLVVSVPHAGRDYPRGIEKQLAIPLDRARVLEDRHADSLAAPLIEQGYRVIVARTPRLLIDFNRSETDFDPAQIAGQPPRGTPLSAQARGGLGLVPWQLGDIGRIWRAPIPPAELARRIAGHHRPYHQAIADALAGARSRYGAALLIDLHSMPRLPGPDPAAIVLGDRHGRSIDRPFINDATAWLERHRIRAAHNAPYAGGHIIERHGAPDQRIHAIQVEVDRSLYLDAALDQPGPGAAPMARLIGDLVMRLLARLADRSFSIAAE